MVDGWMVGVENLVSSDGAVPLSENASERTSPFYRGRVDRFLGDDRVELGFFRDSIPQRCLAQLAFTTFVDVVKSVGFVEMLNLRCIGSLRKSIVVRVTMMDITSVGWSGL